MKGIQKKELFKYSVYKKEPNVFKLNKYGFAELWEKIDWEH